MVGGAGDPRDDFVVEFHCIQRLQRFEETVQRFRSSLEINEDTIRSLQTMNTNLRDFGSDPAAKLTWHCVDTALEQQLADIARHKRDVDGLLRKIQGRGRLVSNPYSTNNARRNPWSSYIMFWNTKPLFKLQSWHRIENKSGR